MPNRAYRPHRQNWWVLALLVGALTAGCGYALAGRGSFLPDYVETIGIPLFENDTAFFEVEPC